MRVSPTLFSDVRTVRQQQRFAGYRFANEAELARHSMPTPTDSVTFKGQASAATSQEAGNPALSEEKKASKPNADAPITDSQEGLFFYQPGFDTAQRLQVRYESEDGRMTGTMPLHRKTAPNGVAYWETNTPVVMPQDKGLYYRFRVTEANGQEHDLLDLVWQRPFADGQANFIPAGESVKSKKLGPIADVFQMSVLHPKLSAALENSRDPNQKYRNHFNHFLPLQPDTEAPKRIVDGLQALLPQLHKTGFKNILLKPFIGGDYSGHGYWTSDPYALNHTFFNKQNYRSFLKDTLRYDMKVYSDGAFVNQGLMGLQYLSNVFYGRQSPYLDWFLYNNEPLGKQAFPDLFVNQKPRLGVLPTKADPDSGLRHLASERVAFRFIPTSGKRNYEYLELFDPRMKDLSIKRKPYTNKREDYREPILFSKDSVQSLLLPVSKAEVQRKMRDLKKVGIEPQIVGNTRVFRPEGAGDRWNSQVMERLRSFSNFELSTPAEDNSGTKWDGQIETLKLNMMGNKDAQKTIANVFKYWTLETRNAYLDILSQALETAAMRNPELRQNPEAWVRAITADKPEEAREEQVLSRPDIAEAEQAQAESPAQIAQYLEQLKRQEAFRPIPFSAVPKTLARFALTQYPITAVPLQSTPYPDLFKSILANPELETLLRKPDNPLAGLTRMVRSGVSTLLGHDSHPQNSFEERLAYHLDKAIAQLPQEDKARLTQPLVQSAAASRFMENLYLMLLTGHGAEATPEEKRLGLEKTVPAYLFNADPISGAPLLKGFLKKRLESPAIQVKLPLLLQEALQSSPNNEKEAAQPLRADSLLLAEAILDRREYGLNWRLDAAKDMGDTLKVRELDGVSKAQFFEKELNQVMTVWEKLLRKGASSIDPGASSSAAKKDKNTPPLLQRMAGSMDSVFPKANVIGELTDIPFTELSEGDGSLFKKLGNAMGGMADFRYVYNRFPTLVHHLRRAGEVDGEGDFTHARVHQDMQQMATELPWGVIRHSQQLTDTHDNEPLAHMFSINQAIAQFDNAGNHGLKDVLADSLKELATKGMLEEFRVELENKLTPELRQQLLGSSAFLDFPGEQHTALASKLEQWMEGGHLTETEQNNLRDFFFQISGPRSIPMDYRVTLIKAAFNPHNGMLARGLSLASHPKAAEVEELGFEKLNRELLTPYIQGQRIVHYTPYNFVSSKAFEDELRNELEVRGCLDQLPAVRTSLKVKALVASLMLEASENKALRASFTNALETKVDWEAIAAIGKDSKSRYSKEYLKLAAQRSFAKANWFYDRAFGYQPLQRVLDEVFDDPRFFQNELSWDTTTTNKISKVIKRQVYSGMLESIFPKLLATYAMQNVIPGQPSIHVTQDLVAQTGADYLKNRYVQNRAPLPLHWFDQIKDYQQTGDKSKLPLYFTENFAKQFIHYQEQMQSIFHLKQRFPALEDGFMLPLFQFDGKNSGSGPDEAYLNQSGLFIMPRSNGKQTVLALVNTLNPVRTSWYNDMSYAETSRMGDGPHYPENMVRTPVKENASIDLKRLDIADGAEFVSYRNNDPQQGIEKRYTVKDGKIEGITVPVVTILERVR